MSILGSGRTDVQDPPVARFIFNDTRFSWFWLIARLYVGYVWISSGAGKLANPAWTQTGDALKGFWTAAVAQPEGAAPRIAFGWYRDFIELMLNTGQYVWFSKFIIAAELAVGIALVLGAFTGIAAFAGGFINWNFLMAGTASINPVIYTISILLVLAWKTAGWIGIDRWLLPALGTPWSPGTLFRRGRAREAERRRGGTGPG